MTFSSVFGADIAVDGVADAIYRSGCVARDSVFIVNSQLYRVKVVHLTAVGEGWKERLFYADDTIKQLLAQADVLRFNTTHDKNPITEAVIDGFLKVKSSQTQVDLEFFARSGNKDAGATVLIAANKVTLKELAESNHVISEVQFVGEQLKERLKQNNLLRFDCCTNRRDYTQKCLYKVNIETVFSYSRERISEIMKTLEQMQQEDGTCNMKKLTQVVWNTYR